MADCPKCGTHLGRKHRRGLQRLIYRDMFKCRKCGFSVGARRDPFNLSAWFIASRYTRCVRCGGLDVHRAAKRDRIDSVSRHPLSLMLRFTGAPIFRCYVCRLQYYDWRPTQKRPG